MRHAVYRQCEGNKHNGSNANDIINARSDVGTYNSQTCGPVFMYICFESTLTDADLSTLLFVGFRVL